MPWTPGDSGLASGTLAKQIYDALIAAFGADATVDDARIAASVALAEAVSEQGNAQSVAGTAPIRINGGANGTVGDGITVSINAATAASAGSMSAADFAKLAAMSDGSYTPTMTPVTNLDSATGLESLYIKCGSMCLVGFAATVDPTATGACEALLSLPFSSAFTTFRDATGICGGVTSSNGRIDGSAADDKARVSWTAAGTGSTTLFGLFVYRIK